MLGQYVPGASLVHRMPPIAKLAILVVVLLTMAIAVREPWHLVPAAALTVIAYGLSRIGPRAALNQLRPAVWMLLFVGAFQWLFTGWQRALVVCGVLGLSVAWAALVSLTTRVLDMLDAIHTLLGPLRRFGVNTDRVGLVLAMTIRCIPLNQEAEEGVCIYSGKPSKGRVVFARAY